jgi:protein O-mannosyl-transferase
MTILFASSIIPMSTKGWPACLAGPLGQVTGICWQPVTWISHALDCQIYGLKPGGHHATNLILHALNSVLVFLVLRQLTGVVLAQRRCGCLFRVAPLACRSLGMGRATQWASLRVSSGCLALWAYARYAENAKAKLNTAKFNYIGSVVLFALALMSKLSAITLPLILLLLDWWPLGRLAATEERPASKQALYLLAEKIPFFVVAIASVFAASMAVSNNHVADPMAQLSFKSRVIVAGLSCFRYLAKSFWPSDLAALHLSLMHRSKVELLCVAVALTVLSVAAVANRKTRPYWLVGWLWFLATLLPLMSLLPESAQLLNAGAQPMADRNMYIPSIGLWMLICWEAYDLAAAWSLGRVAVGGLCAVLLAACCVASSRQLQYWKNDGALVARIPDSNFNANGHADYATYLLLHGQAAQAQAEAEKAIAIAPNQPGISELLGKILLAEGKYDQAIEKLQFALLKDPTMDVARLELGQAFLAKDRAPDAAEEFKMMLQNDPRNFMAHHWLARTYMIQGKTANAVAEYRASLASQKDQPITLNELAWLLATDPHAEIRSGREAVDLASRACALTKLKEPALLGTLAAAYAETGDFVKAVEAGELAHKLALEQHFNSLAETNRLLLDLYRAHKPFHEKK